MEHHLVGIAVHLPRAGRAFVREDAHRHGEGGEMVLQRDEGPVRWVESGEAMTLSVFTSPLGCVQSSFRCSRCRGRDLARAAHRAVDDSPTGAGTTGAGAGLHRRAARPYYGDERFRAAHERREVRRQREACGCGPSEGEGRQEGGDGGRR